jgi:hypothetical protein
VVDKAGNPILADFLLRLRERYFPLGNAEQKTLRQ